MNGRDNITLLTVEFMPEKATATALGISLMSLRRNASMQNRLRATSISGHPYYSVKDVDEVKREFKAYVLRKGMKGKPTTIKERKARGEVILYGITCYPKLRNIKRK